MLYGLDGRHGMKSSHKKKLIVKELEKNESSDFYTFSINAINQHITQLSAFRC